MGFKRPYACPTLVALCLLLLFGSFSESVGAARFKGRSIMSVTAYSSQFTDIKASAGAGVSDQSLSSSLDIEADLRLHSFFSLGLLYGKFTDDLRNNYGVGFRVDTPGYFWIGSRSGDFRLARRKYPVNTSIFAFLLQHEQEDETTHVRTRSVGSNLGLTLDLFLFNPYSYLSTQIGIYNIQGNAYLNYGFGLGIQF